MSSARRTVIFALLGVVGSAAGLGIGYRISHHHRTTVVRQSPVGVPGQWSGVDPNSPDPYHKSQKGQTQSQNGNGQQQVQGKR